MIESFQKNTFYFNDLDPDHYVLCVRADQYKAFWHLWLVWYDSKTDQVTGSNSKWCVDKNNLRHWHYGKHGQN